MTTSTSPADVGCTCRATGTCPTCRYYARVAADVYTRTARRAAERRRLERDWRDRVDERLGRVETALARVGVV